MPEDNSLKTTEKQPVVETPEKEVSEVAPEVTSDTKPVKEAELPKTPVEQKPAPQPAVQPKPTATVPPVPPVPNISTPQAPQLSRADAMTVDGINTLFADYSKIMSEAVITPAGLKAGAGYFAEMINRVLRNPTPAAIDALVKIFEDNKTGLMTENRAMRGITNIAKIPRQRIEIVYTLLRMVTTGVNVPSDNQKIDIMLKTANDSLKNQQFCAYIASKLKK